MRDALSGTLSASWLASKIAYYYLTLAGCVIGIFALWRILYSPFGYALRGPVDFSLTQTQGSRAIPVTGAKLGELTLSGPYIRTSVVVRF